MLRTTFTRMQAHKSRVVAAALAVVIATAFVTAFALGTNSMKRSAHDAALVGTADADVIVSGDAITGDVLYRIQQSPGVAGADGRFTQLAVLNAAGRSDTQPAAPLPETPELRVELSEGDYPSGRGEVAVAESIAERLDLDVGSTVDVESATSQTGSGGQRSMSTVTVTGIFEHPGAAFDADIPGVFWHPADIGQWSSQSADDVLYSSVLAKADSGTSAEELRAELAPLARGVNAQARTADEYAADVTASFTAGQYILVPVLSGFVAVALFVAGMVISNTFTVLVAQRTRELALLRCVGATRRQVRGSVLVEAAVLGVLASVIGTVAGIGLTQVLMHLLEGRVDTVWLDGRLEIPIVALVIPMVLGIAMTFVAAWSPARAATRVAPLAALRPALAPASGSRASTTRIATAAGLVVFGGVLLALGVFVSQRGQAAVGLGVGVLGGAASFLGIAVGAVVVMPFAVSVLGRVLGTFGGVPARFAAVNAVRHPRRTASTTLALFIGVTLVAMMSVGAASAQATFDEELDARYPVDVVVGLNAMDPPGAGRNGDAGTGELPEAVGSTVAGLDGVAATTPVSVVNATFPGTEGRSGDEATRLELAAGPERSPGTGEAQGTGEPWGMHVNVYGIDPAQAREVARGGTEGLEPGVAVVPEQVADDNGLVDGETLRVSVGNEALDLRVRVSEFPESVVFMTDTDLAELVPTTDSAAADQLWLKLTADADADAMVHSVRDVVSEVTRNGDAVYITGAGAERDEISKVLDTMLMVVLGLLGVAVVIALIGVGNTLSLSVIERARESATLRALGLTRRQLRAMLAAEGVLISVIGAGLGVVLGLGYGWLGTLTAIGGVWDTVLSVPWGRFGLILAVAVLAGLLASVLPGRRAAKASPITALAAE